MESVQMFYTFILQNQFATIFSADQQDNKETKDLSNWVNGKR